MPFAPLTYVVVSKRTISGRSIVRDPNVVSQNAQTQNGLHAEYLNVASSTHQIDKNKLRNIVKYPEFIDKISRQIFHSSNLQYDATSESEETFIKISKFQFENNGYVYKSTVEGKPHVCEYRVYGNNTNHSSKVVKFVSEVECILTCQAMQCANSTSPIVIAETSEVLKHEPQFLYPYALLINEGDTVESFCMLQNNVTTEFIVATAIRLLQGLKDYHNHKLIHRDIKPSNLILLNSTLYIIDFSHSVQFLKEIDEIAYLDEEMRFVVDGYVGTDNFIAPEIKSNSAYGTKVDCYSAGITLLQIIASSVDKTDYFTSEHSTVPKVEEFFDNNTQLSKYRDLIIPLLEADPAKRWSAEQALDAWNNLKREEESQKKKRTGEKEDEEDTCDNDAEPEYKEQVNKKRVVAKYYVGSSETPTKREKVGSDI